jgi:hypothetical protein
VTSYQKADIDVLNLLCRVMERSHQELFEAAVQVGVLMASNPDGPAVKHGGYAAFATIKIVGLKDRVSKQYDAELLIDESEWNRFRAEHQTALIDHELSHLTLAKLSPKELKQAMREDPKAPWWKLDDLGRPKLKTVPGTWNAGDGFEDVVRRHGDFAIEYLNLQAAKARADAAHGKKGA